MARSRSVPKGLPHVLVGSYHPSQLNTSTRRLTESMLAEVFTTARDLVRDVELAEAPAG